MSSVKVNGLNKGIDESNIALIEEYSNSFNKDFKIKFQIDTLEKTYPRLSVVFIGKDEAIFKRYSVSQESIEKIGTNTFILKFKKNISKNLNFSNVERIDIFHEGLYLKTKSNYIFSVLDADYNEILSYSLNDTLNKDFFDWKFLSL